MEGSGARLVARFIELAGEINTRMPQHVVNKLMLALNEHGKPLKGSRVCVLGLAYKANVDDDRESPSYEIIELLREMGARVEYCDPYFPAARHTRKHGDLGMRSIPLSRSPCATSMRSSLRLPTTSFKNPALYSYAKLVVDTRNVIAATVRWGAADSGRQGLTGLALRSRSATDR